jgi:FKBP-type peptidyl-prolyl cis-trans isomerase
MGYSDPHMKTLITWAIVVVVVVLAAFAAYKFMGNPKPPTTAQTPPSQTASAGTTSTSQTQVQGQEVKVGTGKLAAPGSTVSVLYVGKLQDGTVFDSSAAHGNQPLIFTLGAQGVIPGFQIGVNGMKEGGERLIAIPPSLGYGAQVVGSIPANSTLIFDVQLVKVTDASSTPATSTTTKKTK